MPLAHVRRTAIAALVALMALPAVPVAQTIPSRSGLPWPSGVNRPPEEFALWRGRPLDLKTVFAGKTTWEHMRVSFNGRPMPYQMVVAIGMVPESHRGQLVQCAAGAFDAQITAIRDNMLRMGYGPRPGIGGSIIRLGWEANRITNSVFPWAAHADGSSWVACFRRWAGILNPPGEPKNFALLWNVANQGTFPFPIERMYPGDDVVDIIGSQFYDRCPPITTEAEWARRMTLTDRWGNPAGLRAWLEFARAHDKPFAVPEWGVGGSTTICARPGFDNVFFIRKMAGFFRNWAPEISLESYFNGSDSSSGSHTLYPQPGPNPRSAAEYRRLW